MMDTLVVVVTIFPPVADVYHPSKIYPERAGVGKVPYVLPYTTFLLVVPTVPPFALNFTVYPFSLQCAYNV